MAMKHTQDLEFQERSSHASTQIGLNQNITMGVPMVNYMNQPLSTDEPISDKQTLIKKIVQVYMFQYLLQFVFLMIAHLLAMIQRNNGIYYRPSESFQIMCLLSIIVLPVLVFNCKSLQQPQFNCLVYVYSVSYALFMSGSVWTVNFFATDVQVLAFLFVLFCVYTTIMGLMLLSGLYLLLSKVTSFQFKYFYILGGSVALLIVLFSAQHSSGGFSLTIACTVIAYTWYFSFALKAVVYGQKFQLTQDQGAFGALAVYCVMMAPCSASEK